MAWRIGVDIGGTFTDVAVVDADTGAMSVVKTSTTPRDIAAGVITALETAQSRHAIAAGDVTLLSHATTVVTNALLEEKGARIALIATRGFRDLLELRRSARADLYDLFQEPPAVLVPRRRRYEVSERIGAAGEVVTPLDVGDLDGIIADLKREEVEAVAVALLFSFQNPEHERVVGEHLRAALPDLPVFLSSEVLPEVREFERTSTTAVCAYVGPILASYLERLEQATAGLGLPPLHVMCSSGGVVDVAECLKMPAMAIESGPAAGVIAANFIGRQLDLPNLITFDMGGTTAKASLIHDGTIAVTSEYEVGSEGNVNRWLHGTGHPIRVPVIDLAEVSAGGGSIAWIDPGGALRVGPQSAGAEPGPVCYGRGGTAPTITDCDLVLGYLDPDYFLGGELTVDIEAARRAVEEQLATPLDRTVEEAAAGVVAVVNHHMADALRIVSIERGHDAREFTLVAFGGAGPVHAASLANALDIPRVVIPPIPGGFSALGLVAADLQRDYGRTFYVRLDQADADTVARQFAEMETAGRAMLDAAGIDESRREFNRSADVRYSRQAYELNVPVLAGAVTGETLSALARTFHDRHRQTYGHDNQEEPIQIVNLRLSAIGRMDGLALVAGTMASDRLEDARRPNREVWFEDTGRLDCAIYDRARLPDGAPIPGPAIIEAADTTVVVPPGWRIESDARGFLIMEADNNE
jgi:N-methylhydantoinase A